jgi:hypothetical protein
MNSTNIGGFFELELRKNNNTYHQQAIPLSTGRACLHLLLTIIKPKKVYVPFYTCDALYEPLITNNIDFEYYVINEFLELKHPPTLNADELLIYINYFGTKNSYAESLSIEYKEKLIIDNTHQFFFKGYDKSPSFTSARKHFGVPDGAYLYAEIPRKVLSKIPKNDNISITHSFLRLMNQQETSYQAFLDYEKSLDDKISYMSDVSQKLLGQIDFNHIKLLRMSNFITLHNGLKYWNRLHITSDDLISPFCYPLLLSKAIDKKQLYDKGIFIPSLWNDIFERELSDFAFEKRITKNLLPLPIDHRYSKNEMEFMIDFLQDYLK